MMNYMRRLTSGVMVMLLLIISWPSVGKSQQPQSKRRPADGMTITSRKPGVVTKDANQITMSAEEKLVRDVYARLMRYQGAGIDELAAQNGKSELQDYLTFEIRDIQTGRISEIYNRGFNDLVSSAQASIELKPIRFNDYNGISHAYYESNWIGTPTQQPAGSLPKPVVKRRIPNWKADPDWDQNEVTIESAPLPAVPVNQTIVADVLRKNESLATADRYASYKVTVNYKGKRLTYRALAIYQADTGNSSSEVSGRPALQIFDNITPDINVVYAEQSAQARAPWNRYVRSSLYRAVVRTIDETRKAGQPLVPTTAPIGFLPGDDAESRDADLMTSSSVTCLTPTVGSLEGSIPSTKNATNDNRPAAGVFSTTNNSTTFASTSTSDLAVLFQGPTVMTITAKNISPSSAANNLRWKIDRDSTDTVATGLPTLSAQAGPQITLTPTVAGNFNVTCWYDTNASGTYNAGEELRVMHVAIVRITVSADDTSIDSFVQFNGEADGLTTMGAMAFNFEVTIDGGGSNKLIGVNKVHLGNVGNLTADSSLINYPVPGMNLEETYNISAGDPPDPDPDPTPNNVHGTAKEIPGGDLPMVDAGGVPHDGEPTGGSTPFRGSSADEPADARERLVRSDDSPGFGPWAINHPKTGNPWKTTQGGYDFREYVVGYTDTFKRYYVSLGYANWTIRAIGTRVGGVWTNNNSSVTLQGTTSDHAKFTITVQNGSPLPGDASGVQVLGKSYVNQKKYEYSPAP